MAVIYVIILNFKRVNFSVRVLDVLHYVKRKRKPCPWILQTETLANALLSVRKSYYSIRWSLAPVKSSIPLSPLSLTTFPFYETNYFLYILRYVGDCQEISLHILRHVQSAVSNILILRRGLYSEAAKQNWDISWAFLADVLHWDGKFTI